MDVVLTWDGFLPFRWPPRQGRRRRETFIDRLSGTVIDGLHNPSP